MESHPRNMAPPPRTGYRTTFTHTSPQNMGPSYVGAHPAFYGQNMIPYHHDNQLRLDLHQQQQQQQPRGFQNVNVAGGHYTYHQASPPTPQYHYGYYGEGPVSPVIPTGPARGRASSRSSGSSAASSTSPVLDLNGSSDIEADDSSTSRGRGVHHVHQTSGYPFPAVPSTPTESVVGSYADSCAEALVNGPGEDLQSVDGGSQRGPQRNSRNGQHETGHRAKRRPSSGNQSNGLSGGDSKYRKSSFKQQQQQQQDSYVLRVLEDDLQTLAAAESEEGVPLSTLADDEYRSVFSQLNELFCRTSYRWLAQYKFRIPRKRYMKDHVSPFDRELTEYVQIIKNLVEGREVPRNAVLDDRLNELVSIMEGASEIRHVNIHVSRRHKPDRRVLGFIAAVNEFCWILGDQRGAMKTNQMYARVEAMTLENRRKLQAEKELQSQQQQQQQQARAALLEKESQKPSRRAGKPNSPSPSPERNVAPAAASKEVAALA